MPGILNALKSDETLMLAYQAGDARAFETVYMRHKDALFNFLFRSVRQMGVVEDLAQDVWMSIIHGIGSYRAVASFRTYLYRIARNRLVDHWRREAHRSSDQLVEDEHAGRENPEYNVQLMEVLNAISALPPEQGEVLLLHEEGFSQQEIAEITESKPETVKSRLRYARNGLKHLGEVS